MILLELFAGTKSISKTFEKRGYKTFSIEWNKDFENIDLYEDINNVSEQDIIKLCDGVPDIIWASPDCTTYSIAGISHHRKKNNETGNLDAISDYAKFCDKTNKHVLDLIKQLQPKLYFIENPRGGLRKMNFMKGLSRYTVTYCQYGDKRMKPTDIWTNHPNPQFKPMCKNGDNCHEKVPRGSRTGTQGLKGAKERSVIPEQLCEHIVDICDEILKKQRRISMKAKEQFKELGYKFSYNQDKTVMQYEKKERQWREEGQININFDLEERTIDTIFRGEISNNLPPILIPEEIEAINQQIKELGWLDER